MDIETRATVAHPTALEVPLTMGEPLAPSYNVGISKPSAEFKLLQIQDEHRNVIAEVPVIVHDPAQFALVLHKFLGFLLQHLTATAIPTLFSAAQAAHIPLAQRAGMHVGLLIQDGPNVPAAVQEP